MRVNLLAAEVFFAHVARIIALCTTIISDAQAVESILQGVIPTIPSSIVLPSVRATPLVVVSVTGALSIVVTGGFPLCLGLIIDHLLHSTLELLELFILRCVRGLSVATITRAYAEGCFRQTLSIDDLLGQTKTFIKVRHSGLGVEVLGFVSVK